MGADVMNYNRVTSVLYRIFAVAAFALLALAAIEAVLKEYKYTVIHQRYEPVRLVEYAGIAAVFAIAFLLRQIREELRRRE